MRHFFNKMYQFFIFITFINHIKYRNILNFSLCLKLFSDELFDIQGVEDVVVVIEEQAAYLKIDKAHIDENALTTYRFVDPS